MTNKNAPEHSPKSIKETEDNQETMSMIPATSKTETFTWTPERGEPVELPLAFISDMDYQIRGDGLVYGPNWGQHDRGTEVNRADTITYLWAWERSPGAITWETPVGELLYERIPETEDDTPDTLKAVKEDYEYVKPTDDLYRGLMQVAQRWGNYLATPDDRIRHLQESEHGSLSRSNYKGIISFKNRVQALLLSKGTPREKTLFDLWAATHFSGKGFRSGGYYINSLTKNCEKDGSFVDLEETYLRSYVPFLDAMGERYLSRNDFLDRCLAHLKENWENPWASTFQTMPAVSPEEFQEKHGFDPHRMAEFITGDSRDLPNKLWRIHETAAIGRYLEPGFDIQSMLILMSEVKGLGKTRWLRAKTGPFGSSYYLQAGRVSSQKDVVEKFRGKTILNLDECDRAFTGIHGADLKETLTANVDNYRAPYDRFAKDYPRSVVVYGTTNQPHLLQDHAGDRRFFIVHCQKPLEVSWMERHWEDYHGFYVWCYRQALAGDPDYGYFLTQEENLEVASYQSEYKTREPWMDALDGILDNLEDRYEAIGVLPSDLLAILGKEIDKKRRWTTQTITDILLTERGYKLGRPRMERIGSDKEIQKGKKHPYQDHPTTKPVFIPRSKIEEAYLAYIEGR